MAPSPPPSQQPPQRTSTRQRFLRDLGPAFRNSLIAIEGTPAPEASTGGASLTRKRKRSGYKEDDEYIDEEDEEDDEDDGNSDDIDQGDNKEDVEARPRKRSKLPEIAAGRQEHRSRVRSTRGSRMEVNIPRSNSLGGEPRQNGISGASSGIPGRGRVHAPRDMNPAVALSYRTGPNAFAADQRGGMYTARNRPGAPVQASMPHDLRYIGSRLGLPGQGQMPGGLVPGQAQMAHGQPHVVRHPGVPGQVQMPGGLPVPAQGQMPGGFVPGQAHMAHGQSHVVRRPGMPGQAQVLLGYRTFLPGPDLKTQDHERRLYSSI